MRLTRYTLITAIAICLLAATFGNIHAQWPAAVPRVEDPLHRRDDGLNWHIAPRPRPRPVDKESRERWEQEAKDREEAARIEAEHLKARLSVSPEDQQKYRQYMKADHSGILVLLPDRDCVTETMVRADPPCEDFVDGGSAYSFRTRQYLTNSGGYLSQFPFQDIRLNNGLLSSNGFLEHGMIISLGDVAIEKVDRDSHDVKLLAQLPPLRTASDAKAFTEKLVTGFDIEGRRLRSSVPPAVDATYVMRLIAYKPRVPDRHGELTKDDHKYRLTNSDKRLDLTLVFRIVSADADGRLTIIWRELQRKDAPTLDLREPNYGT